MLIRYLLVAFFFISGCSYVQGTATLADGTQVDASAMRLFSKGDMEIVKNADGTFSFAYLNNAEGKALTTMMMQAFTAGMAAQKGMPPAAPSR